MLRELLCLDPVGLIAKNDILRWFGYVKHKDDADWIKRCTALEVDCR